MKFNLFNCGCGFIPHTFNFGFNSVNKTGVGIQDFLIIKNTFGVEILFKVRRTMG